MAGPNGHPSGGIGESVFVKARDQFLTSLLPNEKALFATCDSAEQLIKDIQSLPSVTKNSALRRSVRNLDSFGKNLSPYFDAIGWIVQSHPEFAAVGWGAFKLVLQIASNYTSFFEKLLRTLNRLAAAFPPYTRLAKYHHDEAPAEHMSAGIYHGISHLYDALFRFLHQVLRVFRRKDGTPKGALSVAMSIAWKPFSLWFSDLLEDIDLHRKVVNAQIDIFICVELQTIATKLENNQTILEESQTIAEKNQSILRQTLEQMMKKQERNAQEAPTESRANIISRLRQWIHAPEFALEFENALATREEGTAEWLFTDRAFASWRSRNAAGGTFWVKDMVLWVHGNPGSGKTVLAASTLEELRSDPDANVCYFFFRANDTDYERPEHAYRSILAQTLQFHRHDPRILDKFTFVLEEQSSGQSEVSAREALDLIKLCAADGFIQYILLDGLDECVDCLKLARLSSGLPAALCESPTKLILFGRPHLEFQPLLSQCTAVGVHNANSGDIEILIHRRLECFLDDGLLPTDADVADLCRILHTGADSMILWAHLMLEFLVSHALTASKRMDIIRSVAMPEGLDKMYDRIIEHLMDKASVERQLSVWLLMWLSFSGRPLSATELPITTMLMDPEKSVMAVDFTNFERTVISTCSSLVEGSQMLDPVHQKIVPCYRLVHLSLAEYFQTRGTKAIQQFMVSPLDAHRTLARCCLQYLCHLGPVRCYEGTNGQSLESTLFDEQFPLCSYASLYWIYHLREVEAMMEKEQKISVQTAFTHVSIPQNDPLRYLGELFGRSENLLGYIQAKYTFRPTSGEQHLMKEWAERALLRYIKSGQCAEVTRILQDLCEFVAYLDLLDCEWGSKLTLSPSLIWHEVTGLTPCRLIAHVTTKLYPVAASNERQPDLSTEPLSQISEVNKEQTRLSILTIWPSRAYEEQIATTHGSPAVVSQLCSGWMAHYELWRIEERPERIACIDVPLDEEDIWRQCCHSLSYVVTEKGTQEWRLQFPVAISPCLHKFAILRTIFAVEATEAKTGVILRRGKLPLELYKMVRSAWPPDNPRPTDLNPGFERPSYGMDTYMYWLAFDPSGDLLFFIDRIPRHVVNIGCFHISALSHTIDFCPTAPMSAFSDNLYQQSSLEINITRPAFHPNHCLIAFYWGSTAYLWSYKDESCDFPRGLLAVSELSNEDKNQKLWKAYEGTGGAESICFSGDGNYLVLQVPFTVDPVVIPIPDRVLSNSEPLPQFLEGKIGNQSDSTSNRHMPSEESRMDIAIRSKSPTTIGGDVNIGALTGGKNSTIRSTTSTANINVELQLSHKDVHTGASRQASIQLLQLPTSWAALSALKASVRMHPTKQDLIRIILRQAQRPWYSLSEAQKRKAPAVVDRQLSDVKRQAFTIVSQVEPRSLRFEASGRTDADVDEKVQTEE